MGEVRTGQLSAWLQKKKSGSSMVRINQYNRRWCTLDFDAKVFFYSHAEGSQKVSAVTPFHDLTNVFSTGSQAPAPTDDNASVTSKTSKTSMLKRLSSFGMKSGGDGGEEEGQFSLIVVMGSERKMELACASAAEASDWFTAFRVAISMGHAAGAAAAPTGGFMVPPEAAHAAAPGGYPGAGAGPPQAPRSGVEENVGGDLAASIGTAIAGAVAAETAPAPAKKSFLSFDTIEEVRPPAEEVAAKSAAATEVEASGIITMQPNDFGFDEDDDKSSDASSASTPRAAQAAEAVSIVQEASPAAVTGASPAPGSAPPSSYKDHQSGMTMQERLANLEFSDDEDYDDDDPLGLKQK